MKYLIALIRIILGSVAQYFLKVGVSSIPANGTLLIKASHAISSWAIWGGLLCYGLSLVLWLYVLSMMDLSKAYPLVSLGYVFTLMIGYFILNEPVNIYRVIGVTMIMMGVIFVMKS